MANHKKRVLSESEMKRILEDSESEFDDVFSENENRSKSERKK
jgi:arsenate reductase-like glutaredoxin family protein